VLHEDNHLLAVAKPAGLLMQPARAGDDCLLERARAYLKERYQKPGNVFVGLVHRLDRNVSGAVVFARTSKAAGRLSAAFRERLVDKRYLAVVVGRPPARGRLVHWLAPTHDGGSRAVAGPGEGPSREARLRFERLAASEGASALAVVLETGRKHQVRVQLAQAGWPLVGDPRYGQRSPWIARPALHARTLAFPHPVGGAEVVVEAPLPGDLQGLLARLGLAV